MDRKHCQQSINIAAIPVKKFSFYILLPILLSTACNGKRKIAVDKDRQAIIYYDKIAIKNKTAKNVFIKGLEKVELSNYKQAKEYFLKADKLEKNNPVILNALGNTEAALQNLNLSTSYFLRARHIDSNYVHTYINYARLLNQMKKFAEAEMELRKSPDLRNLDSNIYAAWHFNLANAYFGQNKCVESIRQIERAGDFVNKEELLRELKTFKQKVMRECNENDTLIK